jgi:WD40 repeat protein
MSADSWILSRRTIGQTAYRELEYGHTNAYLTGPNLGTFRSCGLGGTEREFDLYTGAEVPLTQQPGVRRLLECEGTGYIARVWDESTQSVILEIPEVGEHYGSAAVLSPGGRWLALLLRDPETTQQEADRDLEGVFCHELALYDVATQTCVESLPLLHNYGIFLKFSPDETMLSITGDWEHRFEGDEPPLEGLDSLAVLWEQSEPIDDRWKMSDYYICESYKHLSPGMKGSLYVRYSSDNWVVPAPDGQTAVIFPTDAQRLPFVIDAATGERKVTWSLPVMPHIAIHPNGRLVAATIAHGEPLLLLDYHTGEHLATLLDQGGATALAWNPAGTHLAVGRFDTTIEVLEIDSQHTTRR